MSNQGSPRRKLEVLRRVLLASLVTLACVVAFRPRPAATRVESLHFDEQYRNQHPAVSLSSYVQEQVASLDKNPVAKDTDDWLGVVMETRSRPVFLDLRNPLLRDVSVDSGPRLVVVKDGSIKNYLLLSKVSGFELSRSPWTFSHPYYPHSVWIVVLGLIAYAAIRWKPGTADAYYRGYVPAICDVSGVVMLAAGASSICGGSSGAAVGWFIAVFGIGFLVAGCYYATLRLLCVADGVRAVSLSEIQDLPFDCIKGGSIDLDSPLLSRSGRQSPRFSIVRIDGATTSMWIESTTGISSGIMPHLEKGGVKVAVNTDY